MRSLTIFLLVIVLVSTLPFASLGQTSTETSVAQLQEEIRKLVAIDLDPNTGPEVRELNRSFLNKRRAQLQSLLEKKVSGLRQYLQTVGASLTTEERQIVQNSIVQAEKDLQVIAEQVGPIPTPPADVQLNGNGNANGNGTAPSAEAVATTSNTAMSSNTTSSSAVVTTPQSNSLNAALNARIRAKVRIDQTDNTKQTETPSLSSGSTSLVDQSSSSDLIGVGLNLAGLSASSNNNQPEPSSVSVTASAYSLLAALHRVDPLNPVFYDQHRNWRRFSITLGYDDEDQPNGTKQRAKLFGTKFMFVNRRDPGLQRNQIYIDRVSNSLEKAAAAFGDISVRVRGYVFSLEAVRRNIIAPGFKNFLEKRRPQIELALDRERAKLPTATATTRPAIEAQIARLEATLQRIDRMLQNPGDPNLFVLGTNALPTANWSREELEYQVEFLNEFLGPNYREKLGEEIAAAVDEYIDRLLTDAELVAFKNLDDVSREAVERIRRAPQLSLAFLSKQRRLGLDEYLGELTFDYGVANRINLTLNGAFRYNDSKIIGGDVRGASFAGQLRFQLNRENLIGKKPFFFDISTQGNWMNRGNSIYKAQGKITIPIADGIEFPISLTYANRTELIKEKEVKGQFGFTVDTARLIRAFVFR